MTQQDGELAGKIGALIQKFPDIWADYQPWLREIMASQAILKNRYEAWQATLIFRWRLLYFGLYVIGIILLTQPWRQLQRFVANRIFPSRDIAPPSFPANRVHYILQRTATLLAMAELTLCGIAAITGILLAFYYQPTALGAHESLHRIAHEVTNGSIILSLHHIAGNGLIGLALIQLVVMFLGRDFLPSWLTGWMSGILLTLTAIGLSWTAIVLSWEQTSFWRFNLELNILASIPWIGPTLQTFLSGGNGISTVTLQHMYTLHSYVLAIAAIFLAILHLTALIFQEQQWKPTEKRFRFAQPCSDPHSNDISVT